MSSAPSTDSQVLLSPRINYSHVLRELSVNSRNPCEVIRELVSNSYDAGATEIRYYPLVQKQLSGFIFFDNGRGMSHSEKVNSVTPYESFFSIGYSTKVFCDGIGYKCQGAKLAFACRELILITRCEGESHWRYKVVQNPREELSQETDITPSTTDAPWDALRSEIGTNASKSTRNVLESLDEEFFKDSFRHGTMIVVLGFDMGYNFGRYFGTTNELDSVMNKQQKHEISYIWNYIRFYTRHGDVRILNSDETGFSKTHENCVESTVTKARRPPRFLVWVDHDRGKDDPDFEGQLKELPPGFPYMPKPTHPAAGPKEVSQLRSGKFYCRHAGTFEHDGETYSWILAIDGNKRALEEYKTLSRPRNRRSGISLADQRGTYLCAQGIKVCEYRKLFSYLPDYDILADTKASPHYLFLLDGPFQLVTDRNGVTATDLKTLEDRDFLKNIERALNGIWNGGEDIRDAIDHNSVFRSLIERLKNDIQHHALEKELKKIDTQKKNLPARGQFAVMDGPLKGRSFVYPSHGEENWVGALYTLLAHFAFDEPKLKDSPYTDLWVRPVNMAGTSIDAFALPPTQEGLPKDMLRGLEYKLRFSHEDDFNHPLLALEYIVCWEFKNEATNGYWIKDEYEYMGKVTHPEGWDSRVAYQITNLQKQDRTNPAKGHVINVASLKELIRETFDCEME